MSHKMKGIFYIILAAFSFAVMNTFVKLAGDLPSIQKSFFRNLIALGITFIILLQSEQKFRWKSGNMPYLILRASFGTFGIICNFYAVDHLLLSDASMLGKLSPFFAILASFILLKEKINFRQFVSIVVAFIGSLFIVKPSTQSLTASLPAIIAILGALASGIAYTLVRYMGQQGERGHFIIFFFSLFSCLVSTPFLIFDYHPMTIEQLFWLLCAGVAAFSGQIFVTSAYMHAPAKEISVFDYTQVVFAALMGLFLFRQIPDIYSLFGYFLICGISILTLLQKKIIHSPSFLVKK